MIYDKTNYKQLNIVLKEYIMQDYQPICCGFDIETTNYNRKAYMYHWQMSINDDVVIGRTWKEFTDFYYWLCDQVNTLEKRLLVWVHNFSFEFQFLKRRLKWAINKYDNPNIFALSKRQICYAITQQNVEFRDSYILTGMTLKKLASTFCKTQKMVGDLDYSILRNSSTILSNKELGYCINDVIILSEFADYAFKRYEDFIPLTKTGIVRNNMKYRFKQLPKDERKEWQSIVSYCFPSENQYKTWMDWIYRGGWVHANFEIVGETIEEPGESWDFESSYPGRFQEKFNYKYRMCKPEQSSIDFVINNIEDYGFMIKVRILGLQRTTCHSIFSLHKTILSEDCVYCVDNGRITKASDCIMMLTEYDYLDLCNFYKWDSIEIQEMLYSKKDYLPKFLIDMCYSYYQKKKTAKGLDRVLAKMDLNSLYGMCVTSVVSQDLIYNEATSLFDDGNEKPYYKAIRGQLLLPQFGIEISAKARHALLDIVHKITLNSEGTSDVYYSDTDSIKLFHAEKHKHIIDEYNEKILARNKKFYEVTGYDFGTIGTFAFECKMTKFKALGCKRYIYDADSETHVVVAGMPKHALDPFIECKKFDVYKYFNKDLHLDAVVSGKLACLYTDEPHEDIVNGELMHEESSVCLIDIPFSMSWEDDYLYLITNREEQPKLFRKRGGQA